MMKQTTSVNLPSEIIDWLRVKAEAEGRSVSGMLTVILSRVRDAERR